MLFLKQPYMLPFSFHKSATACQKPVLCKNVNKEAIELSAPPHQLYKRGTMFPKHPRYNASYVFQFKHDNITTRCFTYPRVKKELISKRTRPIFNPMAINTQMISPTHEKLYFLYCSVRGVYSCFDQVFLQPCILHAVEFV